jgi:hypothetical protein
MMRFQRKLYFAIVALTAMLALPMLSPIQQASAAPEPTTVSGIGTGTITCTDETQPEASIIFQASKQGKKIEGTVSITAFGPSYPDGITGTGTVSDAKITKNKYVVNGLWDPSGICGIIGPSTFTISGIIGPEVPITFVWVDTVGENNGSFTGTVTEAKGLPT